MARFAVLLAAPLLCCAAACSSVQVIDRTPSGGTVAMSGEGAEDEAEELMRAQCPFGYRIVDQTETRIRFACKDGEVGDARALREVAVRP